MPPQREKNPLLPTCKRSVHNLFPSEKKIDPALAIPAFAKSPLLAAEKRHERLFGFIRKQALAKEFGFNGDALGNVLTRHP